MKSYNRIRILKLIKEASKVLDLSDKLKDKQEKSEQEKLLKDFKEIIPEPKEHSKEPTNDIEKKKEEKFLQEVQQKSNVWMHSFSDIRKDNNGFYILKSDDPAANKMKPNDLLADYSLNQTTYWKITNIINDRINLEPIGSNPFKTGVGAGGAKLNKSDLDVFSEKYEKERVQNIQEQLENGTATIDTVKYILDGTVPVNFGPNGSQGGWYNVSDTYSNRGGRKGLSEKEIMISDAKKLKSLNLPVPKKAISGEMSPSKWNEWIEGTGSNIEYFPSNPDKYHDFTKQMINKGKWKSLPGDEDRYKRKYNEQAIEDYYSQMLSDASSLSDEEWGKKYPFTEKSIKTVIELFELEKREFEKRKSSIQDYLTTDEDEDQTIQSIMFNVFSKERRISIKNAKILTEMCKEDPSLIKYLHDIIKLGGAPDYLANEEIIRFFDLVDDVDGLKLAATHLKEPDNIKYTYNYLYPHDKDFVISHISDNLTKMEPLYSVLFNLHQDYENNKELRRKTYGRDDNLLNFIKSNNIPDILQNIANDKGNPERYYASDVSALILKSFGPNMLWASDDNALVEKLEQIYNDLTKK